MPPRRRFVVHLPPFGHLFFFAQWIVPPILLWLGEILSGNEDRLATRSVLTELPFLLLGPLLTLVTREGIRRKSVPLGYALATIFGWLVAISLSLLYAAGDPPGSLLANLSPESQALLETLAAAGPVSALWLLLAAELRPPVPKTAVAPVLRVQFFAQWFIPVALVCAVALLAVANRGSGHPQPALTLWGVLPSLLNATPLFAGPLIALIARPLYASRRLPPVYLFTQLLTVMLIITEFWLLLRQDHKIDIYWFIWNPDQLALGITGRIAVLSALIGIGALVRAARTGVHRAGAEEAEPRSPRIITSAEPPINRAARKKFLAVSWLIAPAIAAGSLPGGPLDRSEALNGYEDPIVILLGLWLPPTLLISSPMLRDRAIPHGHLVLAPVAWTLGIITVISTVLSPGPIDPITSDLPFTAAMIAWFFSVTALVIPRRYSEDTTWSSSSTPIARNPS